MVLLAAPSGGLGALRAGLDDKADANGVVCLSAAGSDEVTESMQLLEACPVRGSQRRFRAFHMANELYGAATSASSRKLVLLEGAQ